MNLRELAEMDLQTTLEDSVNGFGWPVTLTDPSGLSVNLTAQSNDVSHVIDPETGMYVSGRTCSAVVRISTLALNGFASMPFGEVSRSSKSWICVFNDINGNPYKFRVMNGDPDRTLGVVVLMLEGMK